MATIRKENLNKYKILILLLVIFISNSHLLSQSIKGRIVDQHGSGLNNYNLSLYSSNIEYQSLSGDSGKFLFDLGKLIDNTKPKKYEIDQFLEANIFTKPEIYWKKSHQVIVEESISFVKIIQNHIGNQLKTYSNFDMNLIDMEFIPTSNTSFRVKMFFDKKESCNDLLFPELYFAKQSSLQNSESFYDQLDEKTLIKVVMDSIVVTGPLLNKTTYTNFPEIISDSIDLGTLELELKLLRAPYLLSPPNFSTNNIKLVYLAWDSVEEAESYTIEISEEESFSSSKKTIDNITVFEYLISDLAPLQTYFWRVRSSNRFQTSDWSEVRSFKTRGLQPSTPITVEPPHESVILNESVLFQWDGSMDAHFYSIEISETINFDSLIYVRKNISDMSLKVDVFNNSKIYFWRVNAVNDFGLSEWSEIKSFRMESAVLNSPQLIKPTNGSLIQQPNIKLIWKSLKSANGYNLQISNNAEFDSLLFNYKDVPDSSWELNNLEQSRVFYWRVCASNIEAISNWSEVWSFKTDVAKLQAPIAISPLDKTVNQPINILFEWEADPNALSYSFQISETSDFLNPLVSNDELIAPKFQLNGLKYSSTFYWRVRSKNSEGTSNWSDTLSFNTIFIPSKVVLQSPPDKFTDSPLSLVLTWNQSTDATGYIIEISADSLFTNKVNISVKTIDRNVKINGLDYFSKYYWRVKAVNDLISSEWSDVWTFMTVGTLPYSPEIITPINGELEVPTSPTFYWEKAKYASNYSLQISEDESFSHLIYSSSEIKSESIKITGLKNSEVYYWRVISNNKYGNSEWSKKNQFRTIVTFPLRPVPIEPNNKNEIPVKAVVNWNKSYAAESYRLQIAKDANFKMLIINEAGIKDTVLKVEKLTPFTKYFWRISGNNNYGSSSWSKTLTFRTIVRPCSNNEIINFMGKTYNTVQIGTLCWFKENIDVGVMILKSQNQTNNNLVEKYCYNDDPSNCEKYGGLYNWNEAMKYESNNGMQGICPNGWRIPTSADFEYLISCVDGDGNILKSEEENDGSNLSGFSILLGGGYKSYYSDLGNRAILWSSNEISIQTAYQLVLYKSNWIILNEDSKKNYYSIRCVKDE